MIVVNLLFVFCLFLNGCFGSVEFYFYGLSYGDEYVLINDDGSLLEIYILILFLFFNY